MKIVLRIDTFTDSGHPTGAPLHTGFLLPRGCGIEIATTEIGKAAEGFSKMAIELFKADTEGREPKLDLEE